ncbi:MAG TPA: tripartite tricarboxylate transporter TctB family protein, partial [Candidatus Binatia bacterium]
WQRPPLLVGLVLGTITERNFWISTRAYGAGWLTHPGVLIIAVLIVGAIVYSIRQILREKRQSPSAVAEAAPEPEMVMLNSPVYRPLFALFFVGLFVYVLRETFFEIRPMEERAALFPMFLGVPCLALALFAFGQELFNVLRRAPGGANPGATLIPLEPAIIRTRAISIVSWILGFFLAIWLLGFVIAVPVASFLYFRFAGGEKWPIAVSLSLAAGAVFYGLFDYFLHLPFPEGTLLVWLNLYG